MVKFPFVRIWGLFNYDSFIITKEGTTKALKDEYGTETNLMMTMIAFSVSLILINTYTEPIHSWIEE